MPTAPSIKPKRVAKPKAVSKPKLDVAVLTQAISFVACLSVVAVVTYGFSILLGNSVKENASRDTLRAAGRARVAQLDIEDLRQSADRKTTMDEIQRWAVANGYEPSMTPDRLLVVEGEGNVTPQ